MTKVFIDSAMSIDGFWADRDGQSVFPLDDLYSSGILKTLVVNRPGFSGDSVS